jgi:hypothetical protein
MASIIDRTRPLSHHVEPSSVKRRPRTTTGLQHTHSLFVMSSPFPSPHFWACFFLTRVPVSCSLTNSPSPPDLQITLRHERCTRQRDVSPLPSMSCQCVSTNIRELTKRMKKYPSGHERRARRQFQRYLRANAPWKGASRVRSLLKTFLPFFLYNPSFAVQVMPSRRHAKALSFPYAAGAVGAAWLLVLRKKTSSIIPAGAKMPSQGTCIPIKPLWD